MLRGLVALGVLGAVALASMYYGMTLVKSGQSMSMSDWGKGLARSKLRVVPNYLDGLTARPERLDVDIKFKHYQKLVAKREEAMEKGHLYSLDSDWVPAVIRHRGERFRCELRLKGDLPDHWKRPKVWSYKVKLKGDQTIFGMKRFALQDARTRKFLNEWVMHKLQAHLDLIALRYEFVDLTVNGISHPIYAVEENFEKRLVENNRRREGPIVRYDQWFYWIHDPGIAPELAGGSPGAYQEKKYVKDPIGSGQLSRAFALLDLYRRGKLRASEAFDVDRLGAFFAMCDFAGYHHATRIDNLKFYYNPVTSLLEPVGYDFNHIRKLEGENALLSARILPRSRRGHDPGEWTVGLFADEAFLDAYLATLRRFVEPSFVEDFFASIREEMDERLAVLHKSHPWYDFQGREILAANQAYLRRFLDPVRTLQAYVDELDAPGGEVRALLHNIHCLPADVVALESPSGRRFTPTAPLRLEGYDQAEPVRYVEATFRPTSAGVGSLRSKEEQREGWRLVYTPLGGAHRTQPLHPISPVQPEIEEQLLRRTSDLSAHEWITVDEETKTIAFHPGRWGLTEDLILPAGYEVTAGPGTVLDLRAGAMLVSHSPLRWIGSEEAPVRVTSSDREGQGVAVIGAEGTSKLWRVEFIGLSNPDKAGWNLTGAVTFYESPVEIADCTFAENRCEDALNILRATFRIERSVFRDTHADAFDGDFCEGLVADTQALRIGNDAFDVSGSVLELSNVLMREVGDKGLSIGENSLATARDVVIERAAIAVGCKDLSRLTIDGLRVAECQLGFCAFQKKPEFGPAHILVTGYEEQAISRVSLIDPGSSLVIDGHAVEPVDGDTEELLYGTVYGKASQ